MSKVRSFADFSIHLLTWFNSIWFINWSLSNKQIPFIPKNKCLFNDPRQHFVDLITNNYCPCLYLASLLKYSYTLDTTQTEEKSIIAFILSNHIQSIGYFAKLMDPHLIQHCNVCVPKSKLTINFFFFRKLIILIWNWMESDISMVVTRFRYMSRTWMKYWDWHLNWNEKTLYEIYVSGLWTVIPRINHSTKMVIKIKIIVTLD